MDFRPVNEYLVCKQIETAAQTKGGLHIPEGSRKAPNLARIIRVPDGQDLFKKDEIVLFKEYQDQKFEWEEVKVLFIKFEHVLSIFIEDDEPKEETT